MVKMKFPIALLVIGATFALPQPESSDSGHNRYRRYHEIRDFLTRQQNKYGPRVISVGQLNRKTAENRAIPFVKITGSGNNRKRIFIESGIHAREWIAPAATLYFIERLLTRADNNAQVLFRDYDWYIVPLVNPDGYEYTFTTDRNWRKNRRALQGCGANVFGVDLNRNFDAEFSVSGASSTCASDTYHGPFPFSEAETCSIRDKVEEIMRDEGPISAYISLSAFGQNLYTPYAYTKGVPSNNNAEVFISKKARAAIQAATGKTYGVGSAGRSSYVASGTGTDWAFMKESIRYSLAFALRPTLGDKAGFDLPPSEINPTGEDVWAGLGAIARNL